MGAKNVLSAIPLTSFDSAGLDGTFQAINAGGLPYPCEFLRVTNTSGEQLAISFDGINDHDFMPAESSRIFRAQQVSAPVNKTCLFSKGTVVSVRDFTGLASIGLIYLSGYYIK